MPATDGSERALYAFSVDVSCCAPYPYLTTSMDGLGATPGTATVDGCAPYFTMDVLGGDLSTISVDVLG